MPTIHDVARKAGVSVMTVSRVMNKPEMVSAGTIRNVRQVMEKLGYQPSHVARSLVKRKTNTLGIVMPDIKNTFFNGLYRIVDDYARRFGYTTLLGSTDEDSKKEMNFVRLFQGYRVDGILIVPHSRESVDYLLRCKIITILVDRMYGDMKIDFITNDHYDGALRLTQHLIDNGHRKIGVLKGPGFLFPDVERYRGFCDAMRSKGLEITPHFIKNFEFKEDIAYEGVKKMLEKEDRPTALFSFNSLMTIGAIKAMNSLRKIIPDDLSVVCYDEIPGNGIFKPEITHVLQPIEELGRRATKMLIDKIERPKRKKRDAIYLKPELVIGDSCRNIGLPPSSGN